MAQIREFKALRFNEQKAGELKDLVTPPYDIISNEQQAYYYEKNKNNVIRLEYGIIYDDDTEENNRYTRAKEHLDCFLKNDILKQDEKDGIYIYEQEFITKSGEKKSFKGIITLVKLEEFEKQVVIPHEETLSKAKTDRFNLMDKTHCNFSQVYCLYKDEQKSIYPIIDKSSQSKPEVEFTTEEGIIQKLWIINDKNIIDEIKKGFLSEKLYIADGHHRYETALNFRNKLRDENKNHTGDELYNYVMMFLVNMDNEGLLVYPTHRMIKDIKDFSEEEFVSKLTDDFDIEKINDISKIEEDINIEGEKCFGLYTGKDYFYKVTLKNKNLMDKLIPERSHAYKNLDVTILHTGILERFLNIDKENMAAQKNLVYTRDLGEAIDKVKSGEFQFSFILNSTKIDEIKDVTLNKEKMPQKSTYFWPKLTTGIVMNKF